MAGAWRDRVRIVGLLARHGSRVSSMDEKLGFTKDDQCRQQYEEVSAAVLVLLSLLQLSLPLPLLLLPLVSSFCSAAVSVSVSLLLCCLSWCCAEA